MSSDYLDYSSWIADVEMHDHKQSPANTPVLMSLVQTVIVDGRANPEQRAHLIALERRFAEWLAKSSLAYFPGSSATVIH
jgi:hypothetical protein